jgi:hypothetical protein
MYIATPLSKHISGFEYDYNSQILTITFNPKGHKYQYFDVPVKIVKGLSDSSSKSAFFVKHIKNQFKTIKIH